MSSLILSTTTRFLLPLMLLLSVFLLLRGHNEPGGGFVGGLLAAASFTLHSLAFGLKATRKVLGVDPRQLTGAGLLVALGSGLVPMLLGGPLLEGIWGVLPLPLIGSVDLGTPLLFDMGVYLVVLGATLTIILTLTEE
jgi:multicomponent Na+:H+ antiporter subunit B